MGLGCSWWPGVDRSPAAEKPAYKYVTLRLIRYISPLSLSLPILSIFQLSLSPHSTSPCFCISSLSLSSYSLYVSPPLSISPPLYLPTLFISTFLYLPTLTTHSLSPTHSFYLPNMSITTLSLSLLFFTQFSLSSHSLFLIIFLCICQ